MLRQDHVKFYHCLSSVDGFWEDGRCMKVLSIHSHIHDCRVVW